MAKITKILIKNLFGISEFEADSKSIELLGGNGTGKTSVLDAIRLALTNRSSTENDFLDDDEPIKCTRSDQADIYNSVKIEYKNRANDYNIEVVTAYYLIRDACEEAGLEERIGTHSMRKTFGYHHYQQFKDVVILQKIFNHSSPQITLRYIGIEQDQIDDSYNNFIL